jgi:predicted transposase YdaD
MFIYRNIEAFQDWRIVIIYPSRSTEQSRSKMPPELFTSGRITRIYLNELGEIEQLPIGLAMMVLTTKEGNAAVTAAKNLLARPVEATEKDGIMDMVVTIMSYKFITLNRAEVLQMLDITIDEVRAFQDAKNEGRTEGRAEGQLAARQEMLLEFLQEELGDLSKKSQSMVAALSIDQLKQLSATRKNFKTEKDLKDWLKKVEK